MLTLADSDAYAHAYRVAALAASVGCALQLREEDMASLERAALLHDVGKLAMPDAILRKPAPLTIEEQDLVRQHPQIAADLIAGVPYLAAAAELVRDAHERIDGLGYPNGTRAADVALGARIISRRRRLRRDDPPPRLPRRDHPAARRCSSSNAAPARSSTRRWSPPSGAWFRFRRECETRGARREARNARCELTADPWHNRATRA